MKDLETKLRTAFEKATPDVLETVLSDCREQKGAGIIMTQKKNTWKKIVAAAAVLVLVAGLGIGAGVYQADRKVEATVTLDVNPSIQLTVNRNEKVLQAQALNQDGQQILEGMDLSGSHIDVAVNAVLGSMVRNGYLSQLANSILVSVDSSDPNAGAALQQELDQQIRKVLNTDAFNAAVLVQTVPQEQELDQLAQEYGISKGKAQLIRQLIAQNGHYTFRQLAGLSINELKLLSESSAIQLEQVANSGNASQEKYVGAEAALQTALADAGTTREQVSRAKTEMDYEKGVMVYEVEFYLDGREYDYEIDAISGQILWKEQDPPIEPKPQQPESSSYIGAQKAKQTALAHAGAAESQVRQLEAELDRDDGTVVYEVDFVWNGYEYEYEIDAVSAAVIRWERERDD